MPIVAAKYFDDKVQSLASERHGAKFSIGIMEPGLHHFGTNAAERMNCTSGEMIVKVDGATEFRHYPRGTAFEVAANSGFDCKIEATTTYMCEYL
jgi:uncharacterized protein YaiE (UPF0345 family)